MTAAADSVAAARSERLARRRRRGLDASSPRRRVDRVRTGFRPAAARAAVRGRRPRRRRRQVVVRSSTRSQVRALPTRSALARRIVERPARARRAARRRPQGRRRGGSPDLRPVVVARRPAATSRRRPAGDLRPAGAQGRGRDRSRPPRLRPRRAGVRVRAGRRCDRAWPNAELNLRVEAFLRDRGASASHPLVLFGENAANPRRPGGRVLRAGDVVCADISACLGTAGAT